MITDASKVGEYRPGAIPRLFLHHAEIDGLAIDTRRGSGLEPGHRERHFPQPGCEHIRGRVASAPSLELFLADMDLSAKESTRGQDHRC
jgi:hypothetical protein